MGSDEILQILKSKYSLEGKISKLPGEVDQNFKFKDNQGNQYTLKISRNDQDPEWIDLQCSILAHLNTKDLNFRIPEVIPSREGDLYLTLELDQGQFHSIRLQKWVNGTVMADQHPHSSRFLEQLGDVAGAFSKALVDFSHPGSKKEFNWDNDRLLEYLPYIEYFDTQVQEEIALHFFEGFEQNLDTIRSLRKSVSYNDLNDYNILTKWKDDQLKITGIIDFGDVLYTQTVNELAIACAYAGMHQKDPLAAFTTIVQSYHETYPLKEEELSVLYYLIGARLVISVCRSAYNKRKDPENQYLVISEQPAWELLKKWRSVNPQLAHYSFRSACGLTPCPQEMRFKQWLSDNLNDPICPIDILDKDITHLDLSIDSLHLGHMAQFESVERFNRHINRYLEDSQADIGWGGYGETRMFYSTDNYRVEGNEGDEWRSVHLGLDIWSPASTPVRAAGDGCIHSVANHNTARNYGGTLILEHRVSDDFKFYTLYGHLSWNSIKQWQSGDQVEKGQQIAVLGNAEENGAWPPHLHFQVILDMMEWENDFPGVSFYYNQEIWKSISPNIPFFETESMETDHQAEILLARKKSLGPSLSLSYHNPLHIVRGNGQFLLDHTGRRFLDTVNNVAHVGHEHPKVVEAGQQQMAVLNTNTRYLHKNIVEYAEALLAKFPSRLSVCYFVNSGSEANELALRMARTYRRRKDMIALEIGYHGNTGNTIAISSYKFDQPGGTGKPDNTSIVPMPDTFRGLYRDPKTAGKLYAQHIEAIINDLKQQGKQPAGFIAESILSCGGQIELPEGFLREAYQMVRAADALCIADEVQVGFGRVGSHFWGYELSGVVPDIVTLGKPIGNGHPLGAVICTREVADTFNNGMEYFNTFGGNPVSCAIGKAVLEVIAEEGLQSHAQEVGNYIKSNLIELQKKYPIIGDVRGQGLFLGFELIKNIESLKPAAKQANYLINRMQDLGFLMSTDGPLHNVIKIKPPMCINQNDVNHWMERLDLVFREDPMQV